MKNVLIGREKEQEVLRKALESPEAEMVSVIGRRRIGKTFLVKTIYSERIVFELTGTKNAPLYEQLQNFTYALQLASKNTLIIKPPDNWMEAFFLLINYLSKLPDDHKKVVFLDELPWLSTHKSGFLRALSFFWNSWAVNQNIVVVICGSVASWMIQKVVNDTGGLHNRITKRIHLLPFTLAETELYLRSRNISLNRYHILQLYMAMGGIPHYLKEIEPGKSATQNIEDICFGQTGLLRDEFSNLYAALFDQSDTHVGIIRALAQKRIGMSRNEIIGMANLSNSGSITKALEELQQSGFIDFYQPFGSKKKNQLYRLTDEYSLFYLQFIEKNIKERGELWQRLSQTPEYKIWCGYTFETICLKHLPQIKKALQIGAVYTLASTFRRKGSSTEKGTQIDLVLDRNDHIIHIFEIKFHSKAFAISREYALNLKHKLEAFEADTKTRKHLFLTMIATFGIQPNEHSIGLVDQVLSLDDLFQP
ncbi:MAG TPA: ATP-binding protein [Saprospiraceae bacterium]|nr:ATP-binding protein [Saprospiraceae bacterium]HMQ83258.1 ATP-binding protein [Saprospiraceae bacterium]